MKFDPLSFYPANPGQGRNLTLSSPPTLNPLQKEVEGAVSHFFEITQDWKLILAMAAGGLSSRLAGVALSNTLGRAPTVLYRLGAFPPAMISAGIKLGVETAAFESTYRTFESISNFRSQNSQTLGGPLRPVSDLWKWNGPFGLKEGLKTTFVNLVALKGLGFGVRGENLIVRHLATDLGFVTGQELLSFFGSAPPEGTLPERFLMAEGKNIQLASAMDLLHAISPGTASFEQNLFPMEVPRTRELEHLLSAWTRTPENSLGLFTFGPFSALGLDQASPEIKTALAALGLTFLVGAGVAGIRHYRSLRGMRKTSLTADEKELVLQLTGEMDPHIRTRLPRRWFSTPGELNHRNVRIYTALLLNHVSFLKMSGLPVSPVAESLAKKVILNHTPVLGKEPFSLREGLEKIFGERILERPETEDPEEAVAWTLTKPSSPEEIGAVNERILQGNAQTLKEAGVYYVIEDESIGGNAGEGRFGLHLYVDPSTAQIRAMGLPEHIPAEIKKNALPLVLSVRFPTLQQILSDPNAAMIVEEILDAQHNLLSKDPAQAPLFELLKNLKGKIYMPPPPPFQKGKK